MKIFDHRYVQVDNHTLLEGAQRKPYLITCMCNFQFVTFFDRPRPGGDVSVTREEIVAAEVLCPACHGNIARAVSTSSGGYFNATMSFEK